MNKVHFLSGTAWVPLKEENFQEVLDAYNEDGYRLVSCTPRDEKSVSYVLIFEKV